MTAAAVSSERRGQLAFFKFIYPKGKIPPQSLRLSLSAEVLPELPREKGGIIYLVKGSRNKKALDLQGRSK